MFPISQPFQSTLLSELIANSTDPSFLAHFILVHIVAHLIHNVLFVIFYGCFTISTYIQDFIFVMTRDRLRYFHKKL